MAEAAPIPQSVAFSVLGVLGFSAGRLESIDWGTIVSLYDVLITIRPSPIVALNRAIASAQLEGPARGLEEIRAIQEKERPSTYLFYSAALGELEFRQGNYTIGWEHFRAALAFGRNPMERHFIRQSLAACGTDDS